MSVLTWIASGVGADSRNRGEEGSMNGPHARNSPAGSSRATAPDPEVPAKVRRRQFTADYRRRILKEADACNKLGALGALLRREGLYSSHLVNWRR